MSQTGRAILLAFFMLSSSIWLGGYVAIALVARVATRTLDQQHRVAFFRGLGRTYGIVGTAALAVMLGTGGGLMTLVPWGTVSWLLVAFAALVVLALTIGILQARSMTRMRRALLQRPDDSPLAVAVRRNAARAGWLRATIGALTVALLVLGSILAT